MAVPHTGRRESAWPHLPPSPLAQWEESESKPVRLPNDCGTVTDMSWTDDGQIMTVSTSRGRVYNFLAQMPIVHDACGPNVAYQSSLREITVVHAVAAAEGMRQDGGAGRLNLSDRIVIGVEIEPRCESVGSPTHPHTHTHMHTHMHRCYSHIRAHAPHPAPCLHAAASSPWARSTWPWA